MAHALETERVQFTGWRPADIVRSILRFIAHLFEMCLAMCIGIAVLDIPFLGITGLFGIDDPIGELPELTALVVAFNMSLPMAIWMRVRRHSWNCIRDMTGAMFVEAILLIGAAWLGALPRVDLIAWQHTLMVPAMVVAMLLHLEVYVGPTRHPAVA